MSELQQSKPTNIFQSFRILKGNTRVSVMLEPLWGIPFVLYNFYLSLYMKELGVTDKQIGYIIAIGFIAGTIFSMFGGTITDRLGRKKTTFIFDFISWPGALIIYLFANSFWVFALATIINSVVRIVSVSWNLMVVEDADGEQRVAAFNLLSIINISTGVLIPLAGILVNSFGVVKAERVFLVFAIISMSTMMIVRNRLYTETGVGQKIIDERRSNPVKRSIKHIFPIKAARTFMKSPKAILVVCLFVLFNLYIPLGTLNRLYFAPFMTDVLTLSKPMISILGGVYSAALFVVFVFINPFISKFNKTITMILGIIIQAIALGLLISIPKDSMISAVLCIMVFAAGFGVFRPLIDSLLAEVTEGNERAGIYSIVNTATCIATALIGIVSGSLYVLNPKLLYIVSVAILLICVIILIYVYRADFKIESDKNVGL
ncbi:MAG: MFS transporter [Clostridia bacterium]|nr:MFS transporter [Clostridia bacterium]